MVTVPSSHCKAGELCTNMGQNTGCPQTHSLLISIGEMKRLNFLPSMRFLLCRKKALMSKIINNLKLQFQNNHVVPQNGTK